MMTASKAIIAFSALAVVGGVLVIGPHELLGLLRGGSNSEVASAAKPDVNAETKVAARVAGKADVKADVKADMKPEPKIEPGARSSAEAKAEPKVEAKVETKPAQPASSAPAAQKSVAGALAATEKQAAALPDLAPSKPQAAQDAGPSFDVARVDDDGVAVIAGRAAPGASVELLRDGEKLDTAVADASGQFVMTPPKLPGGKYELSLRAKAPDGSIAQSQAKVPVALAEATPPPRASASAAAAKPEPAGPRLAAAPDKDMAAPKPAGAPASAATAIAAATPMEAATGSLAASHASRIVSRGDSLWAISRRAYGDGARYSLIFSANRDKIHNPDLIYPGQTFVLPRR